MDTLNKDIDKKIENQLFNPKDWKANLKKVLDEFSLKSFNSKQKYSVSNATNQKRRDIITLSFRQLREFGYKIHDPYSLKPKHIQYLMSRWEDEKLSASTLTNRLSVLRLFTDFLGKRGMVGAPEDYVQDKSLVKRSYVNKKDKSWKAVEIDAKEIVSKAMDVDEYTCHQLKLMFAFGLRVKEAIHLKPFKSDYTDYLLVMDGTKGGRTRLVSIDNDEKRQVVDDCKKLIGSIEMNMCDPTRNTVQEINRHYYVMRLLGITQNQLGVTPHGLRHEYLNDGYEKITGHASPVRGGVIEDKEKDKEARLKMMLEAGHGRTKIGAAYYGSSVKNKQA